MDAAPEPSAEQLDLALSEIREALNAQWDQWKHLETRLQFFLGWIATGAGVSVALGVGKSVPNDVTRGLLFGAGLFAMFSLAVLVLAYVPRAFLRPPEPIGFAERYVLNPEVETKLMLIDTIAEAHHSNQIILERR